jgi:O-antigen/teichoic acid export membrane protein
VLRALLAAPGPVHGRVPGFCLLGNWSLNTLNITTQKPITLRSRLLSGSFVLLSGSGLATATNFIYNIAVARFLGPSGFGNATAVYTLLTLVSAVTLSFQIISAKIVAQQRSPEGKSAGYRSFHAGAWACGIAIASILLLFRNFIASYLNLNDPILIVLLAIGVAFYIPLGSRRGYVQGAYGFRRLAGNLVFEGVMRLGGSVLLILLGFGVRGVILANSVAVVAAYFAITPKLTIRIPTPIRRSYALRELSQAVIFFSGQVLINNCDIVLVKHFFLLREAGLYAAVAMVGRVVFSFSQAVVNSMFPLVAATNNEERKDLTVIASALMLVLSIGSLLALGLRLAPNWIWKAFFGAKFEIIGPHGLSYLLALYAITSVVYSLSAVIITYEMSYKIANTSWVQLAFSGVVIAGICLFHSSLRQVILVQLVLMSVLLVMVALPFLFNALSDPYRKQKHRVFQPVRMIRRASEEEVIAEFLKSDFHNPVFRDYREAMRDIVMDPDLDNASENAKRRALFFLRHRALWNELPAGTEWYELELKPSDLAQIRVFPRAQWRKIAQGHFSIIEVAESMSKRESVIDDQFLVKLSEIGDRLGQEDHGIGPIVLIGVSETEPLTILDGNHRLVSAMLASPNRVNKLRFLCGLSPRMMECCWYNTNMGTLFRYGTNVLRNGVRSPKAELARLLESSG